MLQKHRDRGLQRHCLICVPPVFAINVSGLLFIASSSPYVCVLRAKFEPVNRKLPVSSNVLLVSFETLFRPFILLKLLILKCRLNSQQHPTCRNTSQQGS